MLRRRTTGSWYQSRGGHVSSGQTRHSSLAVTSVYLRRLEGEADVSWGKVAQAIGL